MSPPPLDIVILGGSYAGLAVAHNFLDHTIRQISSFQGAPTYRIVLVNPSTHVYWNICAPRVVVSPTLVDLRDVFIPIKPALDRHPSESITFVQGRATGIDTSARKVMVDLIMDQKEEHTDSELMTSSSSSTAATSFYSSLSHRLSNYSSAGHDTERLEICYHALILATGSSTECPLFSIHTIHKETLAELHAIHNKVMPATSVLIVGSGLTGVETAGQFVTHYSQRVRRKTRKIKMGSESATDRHAISHTRPPFYLLSDKKDKSKEKRDSVDSRSSNTDQDIFLHQTSKRDSGISTQYDGTHITSPSLPQTVDPLSPKTITLLSGSTGLLPNLSPSSSAKIEKKLKKQGVRIIHNLREVSHTLNADGTTTCILNNGTVITSDVYISATGITPNTAYAPKNLLDAHRFIKTDPRTLRVKGSSAGPRIYAIGDCANYSRQNLRDVYRAVPVLMENLKNDLLEHEIKLQTVSVVLPRARTPRSVGAGNHGAAKARAGKAAVMPKEADPQIPIWLPRPHITPLSPIWEDMPYFESPRAAPKPPPRKTVLRVKSVPAAGERRAPRLDLQIYPTTSLSSAFPGTDVPDTCAPSLPAPAPPSPPPPLPRCALLTPVQAAQKLSTLKDAHYTLTPSPPSLMPTSRFRWNIRLPPCISYLLKGQKHRLDNANRAVSEGRGMHGLG